MATEKTAYNEIAIPYDANMFRSDQSSTTQNEAETTFSNLQSGTPLPLTDVWMNTWIKSTNYKPKNQGFYIDGRTGKIEAMGIYIGKSGKIIGPLIATAEEGERVEISGNDVTLYDGSMTPPVDIDESSAKIVFRRVDDDSKDFIIKRRVSSDGTNNVIEMYYENDALAGLNNIFIGRRGNEPDASSWHTDVISINAPIVVLGTSEGYYNGATNEEIRIDETVTLSASNPFGSDWKSGGSLVQVKFKQTDSLAYPPVPVGITEGGGAIVFGFNANPDIWGGNFANFMVIVDERGLNISATKLPPIAGIAPGGLYLSSDFKPANSIRFYYDTTFPVYGIGGVTLEGDFAAKSITVSSDLTLAKKGDIRYTINYGGSIAMSKNISITGSIYSTSSNIYLAGELYSKKQVRVIDNITYGGGYVTNVISHLEWVLAKY